MIVPVLTKSVLGAITFFFFYYFFNKLYHIEEIRQAFKNVCLDKMLSDGYFDMSVYIYGRIRKEDMYARLTANKSNYATLYKGTFPKQEDAYSVWIRHYGEQVETTNELINTELSYEDSIAIVNWVYRTMRNADERTEFTLSLFEYIKDFHRIKNKIQFTRGVLYNSAKVDLHFFPSISSVSRFVASLSNQDNTLFFRGHADPNYTLRPSIMRSVKLQKNESKLYNNLLIECPDDFEKCHTHLEKLVKMQHYGLPTRLLDITRNMLVALYFACESHRDSFGELILISAKPQEIKYPQSDTVTILASLPAFSYEKQQEFLRLAEDPHLSNEDFNNSVGRLIHEVRLEKPAFQSEINRQDLLTSYIVYALKNNNRIIKQDGAFILCGLSNDTGALETFRYKEKQKKVVILIDKKKKILEELKAFSINRASLFPEIECVAEYLKGLYS